MDFAKITIFHVNTEGACDNVKVTRELPGLLAKNPPGHSTCNHPLSCGHITPYYRPQRSWGKVMFLHVCVVLFTGGVLSQHALQVVSQHALQQVSRGDAIAACIAGGIPTCLAAGLQGGAWSRGVPAWGSTWSRGGALLGRLLLRAVRILLECILLVLFNYATMLGNNIHMIPMIYITKQ